MPQASQGDLVTGMFCWAHSLFPTLCAKSSGNPLARDLVLQLLERYWLNVNLINNIALSLCSLLQSTFWFYFNTLRNICNLNTPHCLRVEFCLSPKLDQSYWMELLERGSAWFPLLHLIYSWEPRFLFLVLGSRFVLSFLHSCSLNFRMSHALTT